MTSQERAEKIARDASIAARNVAPAVLRAQVACDVLEAIDAAVAEAVADDRAQLAAAEARVKALEADNNKLKGELVSELCVGAKEERIHLAARVKKLEGQREALVAALRPLCSDPLALYPHYERGEQIISEVEADP